MKTTEMYKVMGPVYAAQYMYTFEIADKSNPYEPGTQAPPALMRKDLSQAEWR